ncbi:hypothetical protein MTMN5_02554 [Marinobacter salarius]|nr:hypothetical protein MTMN5_02554 [Marinobacter salarius]
MKEFRDGHTYDPVRFNRPSLSQVINCCPKSTDLCNTTLIRKTGTDLFFGIFDIENVLVPYAHLEEFTGSDEFA